MKLLKEKWERSVQSAGENGENEVGTPSTITVGLVSRKGFCGGDSGKGVVLWHICIMLNLIYIT